MKKRGPRDRQVGDRRAQGRAAVPTPSSYHLEPAAEGREHCRYVLPARYRLPGPRLSRAGPLALGDAPVPKMRRFRESDDIQIERIPPPRWLIEGLFHLAELVVLYGPPEVGKTFLALAWSFCVSLGLSWNGCSVRQGAVVYIYAEGSGGLPQRVRAWKRAHEFSGLAGVTFVTQAVDMLDATDVDGFIEQFRDRQPTLVVIDTLARCFVGGEESLARDMGVFVYNVDRIRHGLGATVLAIHHTSKTDKKKNERGSGALRGAADTMIWVGARGHAHELTVTCEKQKDAERFSPITVRLKKVVLDDGRSSCVAIPQDGADKDPARLTVKEKAALAALERLGPARHAEWMKKAGLSQRTFDRVREDLVEKGRVVLDAGSHLYRISATAMAPPTQCHGSAPSSATPAPPLKGAGRVAGGRAGRGENKRRVSMRPENAETPDEREE